MHSRASDKSYLLTYFTQIQNYDAMCRGFVWEWCDYAVHKGTADNGKAMDYYCGNHGEQFLHNYMDFTDLKEYLYLNWEINCDGVVIRSGTLELKDSIRPHADGSAIIKADFLVYRKCHRKVSYQLKQKDAARKLGHLLGFDEVLLKNGASGNQKPVGSSKSHTADNLRNRPVFVEETDRFLTICGQKFRYVYNLLIGVFTQIIRGGNEYLGRSMEVICSEMTLPATGIAIM